MSETEELRLGVNIDHVATVRNARGGVHPDPVRAAVLAEQAGWVATTTPGTAPDGLATSASFLLRRIARSMSGLRESCTHGELRGLPMETLTSAVLMLSGNRLAQDDLQGRASTRRRRRGSL